jgi:hypothetical protein
VAAHDRKMQGRRNENEMEEQSKPLVFSFIGSSDI